MPRTEIRSFVKINLSIDVGPVGDNGYHPVDMVMQQLSFHDDVTVEYTPSAPVPDEGREAALSDKGGSFDIEVRTNRYYLPVDRRNLAYQAAELMAGIAADIRPDIAPGKILIDIHKRIPVAGGLAGGSGNGAAVLHALNIIWNLGLTLSDLMDLGARLGSDVPFCVMGEARANRDMPDYIKADPLASSCARATGRGTELEPVAPLKAWVVISKPRFSVSTREVYEGIDAMEITERPDNDRLVRNLNKAARGNKAASDCFDGIESYKTARDCFDGRESYAEPGEELFNDFINVLEEYTLRKYPEVRVLKDKMLEAGAKFALMSGSGPTVFGVFDGRKQAEKAAEDLQNTGLEAYWTRTTL